MERLSQQEQRRDFEFYMNLDPVKSRHFIENKLISLNNEMFEKAQWVEMLIRKLQG